MYHQFIGYFLFFVLPFISMNLGGYATQGLTRHPINFIGIPSYVTVIFLIKNPNKQYVWRPAVNRNDLQQQEVKQRARFEFEYPSVTGYRRGSKSTK